MANLTKLEIKAKLMEIIVDQGLSSETELPDHTRFTEDLGARSIDNLELTIEITNFFGIEIPDYDVLKLKTIGATVDYVFKTLVEKRG